MSSSKPLKAAWYVGLAYALWGFFPIYWKALAGISALQLISHRIVWSFVLLAAVGVVYLTVSVGSVPWIALSLAATFAIYSLMKKVAPLTPVQGLAFETGILFVPAALYLIVQATAGRGAFMQSGPLRNLLMLGSGPVTTLPLLMFAAGVRHIPLSLVGMLQYINPTLQITIGVMLYREPFTRAQFIGFGLVWSA